MKKIIIPMVLVTSALMLSSCEDFLTKAPDRKQVEQIFSCYERKVTVPVKDSIGMDEE